MSKVRPNTLVKLTHLAQGNYEISFPDRSHPFLSSRSILYLGEIQNMLGHGIFVVQDTGGKTKLIYGYHIEDFVELTQEET